jgi:hypothetical protein
MAFRLPVAPSKYSKQNEDEARRLIQGAVTNIQARLQVLEATPASSPSPTPPTAGFTSVETNLSIAFTDTSTPGSAGTIDTWLWNFGDGQTSTSQNPTHVYATAGDYTVTLTVTDTDEETDDFQAIVSPSAPLATSFLRVGMFRLGTDQPDIGAGPSTANEGLAPGAPKYRAAQYVPTPSRLAADIALAETHDVILVLNLVGSKNAYASGGIYNAALYESRTRRFTSTDVGGQMTPADAAVLAAAIAAKKVLIYLVDEPYHDFFNDTLSPTETNQMGLLVKSIWPGALTIVRADGEWLNGNSWGGGATPPAGTGWSGVDYGWTMYLYTQHVVDGLTMAQHFAAEKALLLNANLGMIPSINWLNGGNYNDSQGVAACWDVLDDGVSSGYLKGTNEGGTVGGPTPSMTYVPCGTRNTADRWFVTSPAFLAKFFEVVTTDQDAPLAYIWQHTATQNEEFNALQRQARFVAAFDSGINVAATRPVWTGWRDPK